MCEETFKKGQYWPRCDCRQAGPGLGNIKQPGGPGKCSVDGRIDSVPTVVAQRSVLVFNPT